ncbi:MAG TPA: LytTR family DNA-binding domain-containing protein [Candidatus Polarisedimenticolia bacterium]|jgi:two-component system LytT family response regulator|nr:LytTR family DNA-binding domain-containing protein [Candidatus Polarisedimenticolia bacterium]
MSEPKLRVLLVDDEEPARDRLRRLLASFEWVEVAGEAEDGEQALEKIQELSPDLVFLDVQMPGAGGLEVAASLPTPGPGVVFCTAFDQYAVDAFELHAVDYLLKPVTQARLSQALERVRERKAGGGSPSPEAARRVAASFPLRFLAKSGARFHVVPRAEVLFFSSEDGLTKLQAKDRYYWMQPSLQDLEHSLDPAHFFRISRSAIVNLNAIGEVAPLPGGHGEIRLANGARLEVSRRRFKSLMDRLSSL